MTETNQNTTTSLLSQGLHRCNPLEAETDSEEDHLTSATIAVYIAGGVAGMVLLIVVILVIVLWKRERLKKLKGWMEENKDLNPVYGTYNRGWDGEGDYGDGDIMEVTDNNDYCLFI